MAQAETIADTIAFQVTETYRHLMTARRGIDLSRPAVAQAEENNRLVRARAKLGDATTAEITDAESTLTRAQQAYLNSIHDYLIALSRLEYAMGYEFLRPLAARVRAGSLASGRRNRCILATACQGMLGAANDGSFMSWAMGVNETKPS